MLNRFKKGRGHDSKPRFLLLRNILNLVFMLMALVGMVGLIFFREYTTQWQILCLLAVCVKMVEVMFRMPGFKK